MSVRTDLLIDAMAAIDGDRNKSYGEPADNFGRTAKMLNAYFGDAGYEFNATDVAIIMMIVKTARLWESPDKRDNWLDLAGYAACGWECAA